MTDVTSIHFDNGAIKMAGNLYLPDGFDDGGSYPAIVSIHPGGGVKEQTAGLYAQKLAEHGFITLAFDASHQGASGGVPHFLDDPMRRVGDIYSAVDYLTSLAFVDGERIGALGICAGSGAAIRASSTERRIKAVATVSAVDVGAATRKGWDGMPLLVIAGTEAGSLWHSRELYAKAPGPKGLVLIDGATHMDLYDGPLVDEVVSKLSPFFAENLGAAQMTAGAGTRAS